MLKTVSRYSSGRDEGFTLVEILISMVIILILVVAITPLLVFNAQSSQYNRAKATSKNLANERIEEIRAMDFASIGVQGSNPTGTIAASETVNVDGKNYTLNTFVNWEDQGGCMSGANAEWDVKLVRVEVVSSGYYRGENTEISEVIEILVSRDSEQPLLLGANIRVCVFRGWDYEVSAVDSSGQPVDQADRTYTPAASALVEVSGPQTAAVYSTAKGAALFIDLAQGDYEVKVSKTGMVVMPDTYPRSVTAVDNSTAQEFAFIEYPGSLSFILRDGQGNPVVIDESGFNGSLVLSRPYGSPLTGTFSRTDFNGHLVPQVLFGDLWPHPEESASYYTITDVNIPGYRMLLNGIHDAASNQPWSGYFDQAGQAKTLYIYLWPEPVIDGPASNADSWTLAASGNIDHTLSFEERIAREEYLLKSGIFNRNKPNNNIALAANESLNFIGTRVACIGDGLNIGNHSSLELNANYLYFENEIILSPTGNIVLNVLNTEEYDDEYVKLLYPGAEDCLVDGNQVLIEKEKMPSLYKGSEIGSIGSFGGFPSGSPWNNVDYGVVFFENDVIIDQPGQNDDLIISGGVYYFPHGFSFASDWDRQPDAGGLIRFTE